MSEWINIKDKLPPQEKDVLLFLNDNTYTYIYKGYRCLDSYYQFQTPIDYIDDDLKLEFHIPVMECSSMVTHWMPLPEPPKEQK